MSEQPGPEIWKPLLRAVETEPQDVTSVRGASGLDHPVAAVGVDERRKRLVVVSSEPDARSAALAQADIQTALPNVHVVLARPVALNPADFAAAVQTTFGSATVGFAELNRLQFEANDQEAANKLLAPVLMPLLGPFIQAVGPLGFTSAISQALVQLSKVKSYSIPATDPAPGSPAHEFGLDVSALSDLDPQADDRALGICSLPLFAFQPDDLETLARGDSNFARDLLRRHDALQYFFPSPDQLALGLLDRAPSASTEILQDIAAAPRLGHPFGEMDLVARGTPLDAVLDALQEKGLVVQGELELTADGEVTRANVKFTPREGVVSKILNRVTIKIDLSTRFFGGG
ncbi:MAG TPA: hypothetical protein VLV46_15700 [Gaiellaceae bacterium]|nr:hypothetical protein [Gaiellaceae bacterium]